METVTTIFTSEYRTKGSKFFGYLCPSSSHAETDKQLITIKNEHPTATHHCYAYIFDTHEPEEFASDAGEPSGTAGLPILNTLKSFDLMNVVLVVVRYFGGTKLGKSGLIDAYQTTSQEVINASNLKSLIPIKSYRLIYDYAQQSLINKWKNKFTWIELDSSYLQNVELIIGCPLDEVSSFEEIISSHEHELIKFELKEESFHVKE